jgi:hypothetical protein
VLVDRADHGDDDGREQDEEAPEDRRVDRARDDPLKQLLLTEHDDGLVLDALRGIAEAVDGLAEPDEVNQELGSAGEQEAADGERSGEGKRSRGDVYGSRAFPRSAIRTVPFAAPP